MKETSGIIAKDLYELLKIKQPYYYWLRKNIKKLKLVKNVDYSQILSDSTGGRKKIKMTFLSIESSIDMCTLECNVISFELRQELKEIQKQVETLNKKING